MSDNWYHLIGVVLNPIDYSLRDLRILDMNKKAFKDVPYEVLRSSSMMESSRTNFIVKNSVHCLDGSYTSLPRIIVSGKDSVCVSNDFIIVLAEIVDEGSQQLYGYRVTDYTGDIYDFTVDELLSYQKVGYHNAQVVLKNGILVIEPVRSGVSFNRITKE